jgi:hypothetical protein
VTPESVRATIEGVALILINVLAVYRENGCPIREDYLGTLAAYERVLRR